MLKANVEPFDIGEMKFGKSYDFTFEVTNELDKDMVINKIQVSCNSCTKATMPNKVKGNQTAKVNVKFTPGVTGNVSKWIDIRYDDDQVLRLKFIGVVNE